MSVDCVVGWTGTIEVVVYAYKNALTSADRRENRRRQCSWVARWTCRPFDYSVKQNYLIYACINITVCCNGNCWWLSCESQQGSGWRWAIFRPHINFQCPNCRYKRSNINSIIIIDKYIECECYEEYGSVRMSDCTGTPCCICIGFWLIPG